MKLSVNYKSALNCKSWMLLLKCALTCLVLIGCAVNQNVVYFDIPSHSLGRIISNASAAKTRTEILDIQRRLIDFQDEHLEYFPDRVSRLIKSCNYVLSHNLNGSHLVELSFQGESKRETESFDLAKFERLPAFASERIPKSGLSLQRSDMAEIPSRKTAPQIPSTLSANSAQPRVKSQSDSPRPRVGTPNSMEALSSHLVGKISDFERRNPTGTLRIAVHPFSVSESGGNAGSRSSAFVLEAEIERSLLGKENIQVVTRRGLKDIQAEKKLSESEWNSGTEGSKKYGVQEADLIIRGQATIATNKRSMILNCELLNPSSGVLVASKSILIEPRGGSVDYFLK